MANGIKILETKRQEYLAEKEVLESRLAELNKRIGWLTEQQRGVEIVIGILRDSLDRPSADDLDNAKPEQGEIFDAISLPDDFHSRKPKDVTIEILRQAFPDSLSPSEITDRLIQSGYREEGDRKRLSSSVRTAVWNLKNSGDVKRLDHGEYQAAMQEKENPES